MRYEVVAGAYRDLEQATARLALVDRLAALLAQTPAELRFPRFTGRWREDKAPEDATTTQELVDLYRAARRAPAG